MLSDRPDNLARPRSASPKGCCTIGTATRHRSVAARYPARSQGSIRTVSSQLRLSEPTHSLLYVSPSERNTMSDEVGYLDAKLIRPHAASIVNSGKSAGTT